MCGSGRVGVVEFSGFFIHLYNFFFFFLRNATFFPHFRFLPAGGGGRVAQRLTGGRDRRIQMPRPVKIGLNLGHTQWTRIKSRAGSTRCPGKLKNITGKACTGRRCVFYAVKIDRTEHNLSSTAKILRKKKMRVPEPLFFRRFISFPSHRTYTANVPNSERNYFFLIFFVFVDDGVRTENDVDF